MTLGGIFAAVPLAVVCAQREVISECPSWGWLILASFSLFGVCLMAIGIFGSRKWSDLWGKHTSHCGGHMGLELLVILIAAPLYFTLKAFERK